MDEKNRIIYKENNERLVRRRRSKIIVLVAFLIISLLYIISMIWFWIRDLLTPDITSILLIVGFLVLFNVFTILNYFQLRKTSPLKIYNWGIVTPEPNILSLKQIKFSNVHRVVIDRNYRFTAIFMSIYGKNGGVIDTIGGLDEDDVDHIQQILEERGISVENKI